MSSVLNPNVCTRAADAISFLWVTKLKLSVAVRLLDGWSHSQGERSPDIMFLSQCFVRAAGVHNSLLRKQAFLKNGLFIVVCLENEQLTNLQPGEGLAKCCTHINELVYSYYFGISFFYRWHNNLGPVFAHLEENNPTKKLIQAKKQMSVFCSG